MAHRILPLQELDVDSWNRRSHDHGFALQAIGHGKKNFEEQLDLSIWELQW